MTGRRALLRPWFTRSGAIPQQVRAAVFFTQVMDQEEDMNVYSELLDLLRPRQSPSAAVHFGTLSSIAPLCVTVGGRDIRQGLVYPRGMTFSRADIGRELALLPCTGGFLILCSVEGGSP